MTEQWKDVPGYEGLYQVSDKGRVRSLPRKGRLNEKILKPDIQRGGYERLLLCKDGEAKMFLVHGLVLEAFIGPAPARMECRHLDGTRDNNHLLNLRWGTRVENMADKIRHGTTARLFGEHNPRAKLCEDDVRKIRVMKGTLQEVADQFGIHFGTVSKIKNGERWKHI